MPPGSLLKWHVFTLNFIGFVGVSFWGWVWYGISFYIFLTLYCRGGGMGLYVKCKLQHRERKRNI